MTKPDAQVLAELAELLDTEIHGDLLRIVEQACAEGIDPVRIAEEIKAAPRKD